MFHSVVCAVQEVDVLSWHAAILSKVMELLHDDCHFGVTFQEWSVTGQESSVSLKSGNFNWEVEWCDDADVAEWPSVA